MLQKKDHRRVSVVHPCERNAHHVFLSVLLRAHQGVDMLRIPGSAAVRGVDPGNLTVRVIVRAFRMIATVRKEDPSVAQG